MKYYAHSLENQPTENWQPLEEHLENVAQLAAKFAKPFGGEEWAHLAGLWHDVGKYSNEFQKMLYDANGIELHLETKPGHPVHSQAGGHLAQKTMAGSGLDRIFCWLIMGHHTGLADYSSDKIGSKALEPKMRDSTVSDEILGSTPVEIKTQSIPQPPEILRESLPADISFLTRMIFSCVVDADFLDTENFMNAQKGKCRNIKYPKIQELLVHFNIHMEKMCQNAKSTKINSIRFEVLQQCRQASSEKPTVFSLTVPTGGGKTLSSLAFALQHSVN